MRRHSRLRPVPLLALLLAAWTMVQGAPVPAMAQTGAGDRVARALQQTDAAIERAQRVVGETDSQRARELVDMAVRIQTNAWQQYRDGNAAAATRLTVEARTLAARAVGMARDDTSLQNRARVETEKAHRALARAREMIGGGGEPQAVRLLEQAADMIERARVNYGEQRYQAALRLAVSAQQLIRQAVGMLGDGPADNGSRVRRELERTDHLIERTEPIVTESGQPEALRLFGHGKDLQARAWEAFRSDRLRAAAAATREARSAVNRARSLAQGPIDPAMVERALNETDRLLGHAAELVADSGSDAAAGILERAQSHQAKARRFQQEGSSRQALAETRVARSLAKRAIRVADSGAAR
jgi:hypothetical protein